MRKRYRRCKRRVRNIRLLTLPLIGYCGTSIGGIVNIKHGWYLRFEMEEAQTWWGADKVLGQIDVLWPSQGLGSRHRVQIGIGVVLCVASFRQHHRRAVQRHCLLLYCLMSTTRRFCNGPFAQQPFWLRMVRLTQVFTVISIKVLFIQVCHSAATLNGTQTCCSVKPHSSNSSGFPLWICTKLKTSIKQKSEMFPLRDVMWPLSYVSSLLSHSGMHGSGCFKFLAGWFLFQQLRPLSWNCHRILQRFLYSISHGSSPSSPLGGSWCTAAFLCCFKCKILGI